MIDQPDAPALKPTTPVAEVLVWDVPVRVFHWLLVFGVAGAWLSAESERWRWWHETLGYTTLGLMAFRLVWGWVGTRHARFADFVRSPAVVLAYVFKMMRLRAPRLRPYRSLHTSLRLRRRVLSPLALPLRLQCPLLHLHRAASSLGRPTLPV